MSIADKPTKFKVAAFLLPLSVALYAASLSMNVARVTGNVELDAEGISQELKGQVASEETLEKVSDEITTVITGVVRNEFPMFANQFMLSRIAKGVEAQVKVRGPEMIDNLMPTMEIPQPDAQVRSMKLLQTIKELWQHGDKFLAGCLIAFTIFFPISKYIALTTLLITDAVAPLRDKTLRWLKNWGQWSMGDVFVVAFLVVYMRINTSVVSTSKLADISVRVGVEPGMYMFAGSVILAMICSMLLTSDQPYPNT